MLKAFFELFCHPLCLCFEIDLPLGVGRDVNNAVQPEQAKVTVLDWYKEKRTFLCISKRGISTPKLSKEYPYLDLAHLLWRIRNKDYPVKYTWSNTKTGKLLHEFIKMAQTANVTGKERIIDSFIGELPAEAKVALLDEIA